jgi:hypothetical protein
MAKKFIKQAIKKPGALRATAKRAGLLKKGETLSKTDIAKLKKSKNPKTRKRAQLAETLGKLRKKKRG